jgi:hypothetical protein
MKTTIKFLTVLIMAVSFTFTACDELEDLADVDFTTSISTKIPIAINQGQETVNESVVLSLDNNATHDYLNKIEDVKITKLTYTINNFSGDATGTIDVSLYADNIALDLMAFTVKDAYSNRTVFEVTDVAKLNEMANLLKKNKSVIVGVKGVCTTPEEAMSFNVQVTASLKVTANPL